ncbi:MAG: glycoside hydrolase family 9 protein, partial [Bacteroidota bacterium]
RLGGVNYPVSWQRVANFAYLSYVRVPLPAIHQQARAFILGTLTTYSDNLLKRIEANGYRYVLVPDQYYWGSNSVALGHAFDLLQAYEATRLPRYRDAALDQLHYLLGRNTFSQTFITGVGKNPVTSPYHQFSMMLHVGKPVPGLIVGGSNKNSRLRGKVISQFPGRSYEDNEKNYFVNEVAINYTAPFVFLAGYFSDFSGEREQGVTVGRMK